MHDPFMQTLFKKLFFKVKSCNKIILAGAKSALNSLRNDAKPWKQTWSYLVAIGIYSFISFFPCFFLMWTGYYKT